MHTLNENTLLTNHNDFWRCNIDKLVIKKNMAGRSKSEKYQFSMFVTLIDLCI